jgi:major vault protein
MYQYKQVSARTKRYLAVTFKAPHNSAVQLFDYKNKKSRIVFGPELVMLEPYEEFTLITLSGG